MVKISACPTSRRVYTMESTTLARSTYISLPGRYVVYMPTVNHINVSRRIEDEDEKERLRVMMAEIGNPGEGYIVRTVGQGCQKEDVIPDLNFLHRLWENLEKNSDGTGDSRLLHEDFNLIFRSIRDLFTHDVKRLVIDSKDDYQKCIEFCSKYLPHLVDKIDLHSNPMPIFEHNGLEIEINRSLDRKVWLKSGGFISIDQTEALVAIDVDILVIFMNYVCTTLKKAFPKRRWKNFAESFELLTVKQ